METENNMFTYSIFSQKQRAIIRFFGGISKLSTLLGIARNNVYNWKKYGIPDKWAYKIHAMSRGKFSLSEIKSSFVSEYEKNRRNKQHF